MKNPIIMNGRSFTTSGIVGGTAQNAAMDTAAPAMQKTLVRCARLPKKRSVAQPATTIPRLPPTISKTKQSVVAEASESAFVSIRSTMPQSNAAKRTV